MKRFFKILILALIGTLLIALFAAAWYWNLIPRKTYTAAHFGIEPLLSAVDFDGDGIDDYTDLMEGARKDAQNRPRYNGAYYDGGYPPEEIGVCTDVIWRAFREAGYSFKEMIDADIAARPDAYPRAQQPDPNIDFRRVPNLRVFLEEYAESLTLDTAAIEEWQAGDIIIFGADKHIGIVSDRRNKNGRPYIIHNGGQPAREEDYLARGKVSGHYRFRGEALPDALKIPFEQVLDE